MSPRRHRKVTRSQQFGYKISLDLIAEQSRENGIRIALGNDLIRFKRKKSNNSSRQGNNDAKSKNSKN
jgi:hypothetical protein